MGKTDARAAEAYFLRAHELDPQNQDYRLSVEIARQYVVTQLVQRADEEREVGNNLDSLEALQEAIRLDPNSPLVSAFVGTLAADVVATTRVTLQNRDEASPPLELVPEKGTRTFDLRASEPSVISQALNAYGIEATIDPSVKSQTVRFDATAVDFAEAAGLVKLATNTFLVTLDPRHALAVADTKENRTEYERQVTETIYFPGLNPSDLEDMGNIARTLFGLSGAIVQLNDSTLTMRAPEPVLAVLNQTFEEMTAGRSQLQLDVHMYEIDKTKMTNVGVVLPASMTAFNVPSEVNSIVANNSALINQIISSGLASAGDYSAIIAILIASGALTGTVFNSPFAVFGGGLTETGLEWNSSSANMLLNSSDVRLLDQVQLRVLDQEEATIRSGERYPIITSSFSSLAGNSSSAPTIPQIQYQDLGLTLEVKPHFQGENDLSLSLDLKIASLAGSTINNIPVLNNREFAGVVSLHLGDSALVVSAVSKQDSLDITGVPGLSDVPGFQDATNRQDSTDSMELAIVITPHLVRLAHRETFAPMLLLPQH